jgi:hypothetical protein
VPAVGIDCRYASAESKVRVGHPSECTRLSVARRADSSSSTIETSWRGPIGTAWYEAFSIAKSASVQDERFTVKRSAKTAGFP